MKRIVLTTEQMDRALGLPPERPARCPHSGCIRKDRHRIHETARGVRWTDGDDRLDDSD